MAEAWKEFYPSFCVDSPELSPARVALIKQSWDAIEGNSSPGLTGKPDGYFGERFYDILFERYPSTKALFKDQKQQARALSGMISRAVQLLAVDDIESVAQALTQLATRHHRYGTKPEHYGPVGECLVAAITEAFADDLEAETAGAWVHLYSTICSVMIPVTYAMCKAEETDASKN